ncbi:PREDICTED: uncharacterized protein LOC106325253 [Brassica oleracea var. oleracea]|uniref:RING-type E3 ubiquitin transferase n=1 Tax=Brassica oleracea var. oleracea TaxID=109376 RepID=A0A0D3AJ95_BRAOL|nr:PREDICTED: uncharacterized protein LOC106325253 [Brassica oleracea var. oleracea]
MAKLFGCPINVKAEEEDGGGGSSIAAEVSRSSNQPDGEAIRETYPYFRFLESNSDSGSVSMESEPDLHHCFIDFFDRESFAASNQRLSTSHNFDFLGVQDMEEEIELGLRVGSGSGSDDSGELGLQVTRNLEIFTRRVEIDSGRVETDMDRVEIDTGRVEIDSGRVEIDTGRVETDTGRVEIGTGVAPVGDDLFVDHVEPQNAITWVDAEPVEAQEAEPMDQEWHGGYFDVFFDESVDLAMDDFFDSLFPSYEYTVNNGDYEDVIARTFDESGINGSPPASKRMVDELPDVDVTSEELSIGCAICKDEIVVEEKVKRLPCRHYYHKECIVPWLGIRNTCPVCRYELPTDDLEYERNKRSQRGVWQET